MAISRAQMLKELLPGLNALFGLEYEKYEDEHTMIYETESSDRRLRGKVKLSGFGAAPTKGEGESIVFDSAKSRLQLALITKPWLWVLRSPRKRWKTIFTILFRLATPRR